SLLLARTALMLIHPPPRFRETIAVSGRRNRFCHSLVRRVWRITERRRRFAPDLPRNMEYRHATALQSSRVPQSRRWGLPSGSFGQTAALRRDRETILARGYRSLQELRLEHITPGTANDHGSARRLEQAGCGQDGRRQGKSDRQPAPEGAG